MNTWQRQTGRFAWCLVCMGSPLLASILLAACSPGPIPNASMPPATHTPLDPPLHATTLPRPIAPAVVRVVPSSNLIGSLWTLSRLHGEGLLSGSHIELKISEDTMGGYDGCNWYGVRYRAPFPSGDPASHPPVGLIESTLIGCGDAIQAQSERYFSALHAAVALKQEGTRLQAFDARGSSLLEFRRAPLFSTDPAALTATGWRLQTMDGESWAHTATQAMTLRFEKTTLRGHAGCRDYTGTCRATSGQLVVPSLGMTSTLCADRSAQQREGDFTTLLSETTRYRMERNTLTLFTSTGHQAQFTPCPECAQ